LQDSDKLTELSSLFHATIPFGTFLGTSLMDVKTAWREGIRTSTSMTAKVRNQPVLIV